MDITFSVNYELKNKIKRRSDNFILIMPMRVMVGICFDAHILYCLSNILMFLAYIRYIIPVVIKSCVKCSRNPN
jgi:hypothetical protein